MERVTRMRSTYITTTEQMKKAEALAAEESSFKNLMENAGAALAGHVREHFGSVEGRKLLVLCGHGNNGGDGFVAARLLCGLGGDVTVVLISEKASTGIAGEEFARLLRQNKAHVTGIGQFKAEDSYDAVIDAVYGTGFHGELPEGVSLLFSVINSTAAFKVAADVPSGVDCSDGSVSRGTFRADMTVTFGAVKLGMTLDPAIAYTGEIVTEPIGIKGEHFEKVGFVPCLMDHSQAVNVLPARNRTSHKGSFGNLLIVGGSREYSGAAALCVTGALRSGAGLVRLASVKEAADRVIPRCPECTFTCLVESDRGYISSASLDELEAALDRATVCAAGSGLGCTEDTKRLVTELIAMCGEKGVPLILDADALNCIAGSLHLIKKAGVTVILTPHPGELARLAGTGIKEVLSDRLCYAQKVCEESGAIVAAKGSPTFILAPSGRAAAVYTGNGGLSRGGSGDLLTGIIAGILTSRKGDMPFECAAAGAYLFGEAADLTAQRLSMTTMLPSDVADDLHKVM